MTWRWLLFMHAMDVALITGAIAMAGDFDIYLFVAYYVALALFAVVFTSLWLSLAWTSMVALLYSVVSVAVQPGLDLASGEEKALLGRIAAMYGIVGCVSLIARFERVRRRALGRAGEGASPGTHRALPGHPRHRRADRIHSLHGNTQGHAACGGREQGTDRDPRRDRIAVEGGHVGNSEGPSTRGTCSREGSLAACSGRTRTTLPGPHRSPPRWSSPGPSLPWPWR